MIADLIRQRILDAALEIGIDESKFKSICDVPLETPKNRSFGHYATNLPFALAGTLKKPPMEVAEKLAAALSGGIFCKAEAVKPGFINFALTPETLHSVIPEILNQGGGYGKTDFGGGRRIQVEFVSANPTGPLSVGHGRIAAFGDAIARILEEAGYDVDKEFYVNDVGKQIADMARSMELRCREELGEKINPEELGYKGAYVAEHARMLLDRDGPAILQKNEKERRALMAEFAIGKNMEEQAATLERFGVKFDLWFREHTLHDEGLVRKTLDMLKSRGEAYEQDGAAWFATTKYKDDKDRVLKKSDGSTTYFLADIAYHNNKFERGYETVIDIWGADHHGYIDRMKSAVQALGVDPARLEVLIVQLVRFKQSEDYVKMSKRAGNLITIDDLIEEVGADVARFFFLTRGRDSHLDFDLELAKEKSEANPLFYLQYAHARVRSLLAKGEEAGVRAGADCDLSPLVDERELHLMKRLADYPWDIQTAGKAREPHRIITYLTELAGEFHTFYHDLRIVWPEEPKLSAARLTLSAAVGTVIRNGLALLGVSAPESM
jgi:arginyl-tRNA synthetase